MKKLLLAVGFLFLVVNSSFALDPAILGTWSIDQNDGNEGTLTFSDSGSYVQISGYNDPVDSITLSSPATWNTKEIVFIRRGAYQQVYVGSISTSGCLMTGYSINVNNNISASEKFPFVARKCNY